MSEYGGGVALVRAPDNPGVGEQMSPRIRHLKAELDAARLRKREACARLLGLSWSTPTSLKEQAAAADDLAAAAAQVAGFARMLAREIEQH